jgi:hypothetical protein
MATECWARDLQMAAFKCMCVSMALQHAASSVLWRSTLNEQQMGYFCQ